MKPPLPIPPAGSPRQDLIPAQKLSFRVLGRHSQLLRRNLLYCVPRTRVEHVQKRLVAERLRFRRTGRRRVHVHVACRYVEIGFDCMRRR
jgi:hypothetical protein